MVKTDRRFVDETMIIEFKIDLVKFPSIADPKDLEECFRQLIAYSLGGMRVTTIKQAFARACER